MANIIGGIIVKEGAKKLGSLITSVVAGAIKNKAEDIINGHDASPTQTAPQTATEIAQATAPAVAEAIKQDPVVAAALNMEPWYKSKTVWLSVAGVFSSLGGLVTLAANRSTDFTAYAAALGTLATSVGTIIRNRTFHPTI